MEMKKFENGYCSSKKAVNTPKKSVTLSANCIEAIADAFRSATNLDVTVLFDGGQMTLSLRGSINMKKAHEFEVSILSERSKKYVSVFWAEFMDRARAAWQDNPELSYGALRHWMMQYKRRFSLKQRDMALSAAYGYMAEELSSKDSCRRMLNLLGVLTSTSVNTFQVLKGGRIRIALNINGEES